MPRSRESEASGTAQRRERPGAAGRDLGAAGPLCGDALAEAHRRYRHRLEAVAFRVLRDRAEAEDVVQRVFLGLPRVRYRGAAGLGSYLYRAAVNGALGVLRRRRRRVVAETELRIRQLFVQPVVEGADPEARVLEGVPLPTVGTWLRRGRQELRVRLAPLLRDLDPDEESPP